MLALDIDPKLAWALGNQQHFPIDLNRAPREMMLRVPGLGVRTVDKLDAARRVRKLRSDDLKRLRIPLQKVMPFVVLADYRPSRALHASDLVAKVRPIEQRQGSLFDA